MPKHVHYSSDNSAYRQPLELQQGDVFPQIVSKHVEHKIYQFWVCEMFLSYHQSHSMASLVVARILVFSLLLGDGPPTDALIT